MLPRTARCPGRRGGRLPDLLSTGLRVVFCGTAAGTESAVAGAYYAGPGNRFWSILHESGFTPRQLAPSEFRLLPEWGIGLTTCARRRMAWTTRSRRTRSTRRALAILDEVCPHAIAFNGKKARLAFGFATARRSISGRRRTLSAPHQLGAALNLGRERALLGRRTVACPRGCASLGALTRAALLLSAASRGRSARPPARCDSLSCRGSPGKCAAIGLLGLGPVLVMALRYRVDSGANVWMTARDPFVRHGVLVASCVATVWASSPTMTSDLRARSARSRVGKSRQASANGVVGSWWASPTSRR